MRMRAARRPVRNAPRPRSGVTLPQKCSECALRNALRWCALPGTLLYIEGTNMDTRPVAGILSTILHELVEGSDDPKARTYVLNQGDRGLLESVGRLSAAEASQ